jgi:hypothetical protein
MEGVQSLDEIYDFYRNDEVAKQRGQSLVMLQFLDLVADVLRSRKLCYGTSHLRLGLSRFGSWAEPGQQPSILISADGEKYVCLSYLEGWDDGPFYRSRWDSIKCRLEHSRAALLEMLARMKAYK